MTDYTKKVKRSQEKPSEDHKLGTTAPWDADDLKGRTPLNVSEEGFLNSRAVSLVKHQVLLAFRDQTSKP